MASSFTDQPYTNGTDFGFGPGNPVEGFTMDETVSDLEPNATHPEPQFSINNVDNAVKVYLKSMNEPEAYTMVPNGPNGPDENGPNYNYWLRLVFKIMLDR